MKRHRESMRFVANLLNQMQNRRVPFEHDGLIFPPQYVKNFFLLCDARERLIDDGKFFERFGRGVKLADSAVNQNQAGQRLAFILQTMIAALHGFLHAGEIVAEPAFGFLRAVRHGFAANYKFSVIGFLHSA